MGLPDLRVFLGGDACRKERDMGIKIFSAFEEKQFQASTIPQSTQEQGAHRVLYGRLHLRIRSRAPRQFNVSPRSVKLQDKAQADGAELEGCLRILCVVLIWPQLIPRPPLTCRRRWSQTAICRSATAHVPTSLPCPSCREPCVLEKVQAILNAKPY